ncbi:hypothetical protein EYF80_045299 [Liparis tanakae]|uniref:Uncharacterized protein n=1 Tax=Liparis tanakae TaxID=230148 RepID=A0A4Z2FUP7_9TELE|nr:hypothetical protein EYF80_045299 [Liparis tanakae]
MEAGCTLEGTQCYVNHRLSLVPWLRMISDRSSCLSFSPTEMSTVSFRTSRVCTTMLRKSSLSRCSSFRSLSWLCLNFTSSSSSDFSELVNASPICAVSLRRSKEMLFPMPSSTRAESSICRLMMVKSSWITAYWSSSRPHLRSSVILKSIWHFSGSSLSS